MNKEKLGRRIISSLQQAGYHAYFAGGCVRDRERGVEPKDFDIATSAKPEEVQRLFPKTVPVGISFGVILVIEEGIAFEVATFRKEEKYLDGRHPESVSFSNLEQDAQRRDFTVNGLYFDTTSNQVIDQVGGRADIKRKLIQTIGDPEARFLEDHLRMMRAIRFAVQLEFDIAPKTFGAIQKHSQKIKMISAERVRDELIKIVTSPQPARGIRLLDVSGLLEHILPEIGRMKGVEQPMEYHPEGDVFIHTLLLLEGLKNAEMELAMGALLHDVAKPNTFQRAADRIRFHGHDVLGAQMTREICKRLAFSNEETELIASLVLEHLRFKDIFNMRLSTLKRFLSLPRFDLHLEQHRLDCMASHGKLDAYHFARQKYEEFLKEPPPPLRIVTGEDLIQMGFTPGPTFSTILRDVEDQILEGRLKEKKEALEYVQEKFISKETKS